MCFIKSYDGEMRQIGECMGCSIVENFDNDKYTGQVVKTKNFTIAQDFELPINGFMVISSVRHLESINEMTNDEKLELITLIDVTVASLKKLEVCPQYNVVWEEKYGNHFHVWLMPRHDYLTDAMGTNIMKKIGYLFKYAKDNLRTEENLKAVEETIIRLKEELKANETIKDWIV